MHRHRLAVTLALLLSLSALLPAAALAGGRAALVIGMSAYRHTTPLANPANDAKDMSAALRELGFVVTQATDLDKRALEEAVRAFANRIAGADVALLFYAGHALQVAGQNYLLAADARLESERDLDFESVRLEFLLRQLETGRAGKTSIVILDACRDNPLARTLARALGVRSDALSRGLAPAQSGAGMFIAFSTQPGNVARDGTGRNSPFAAALLRHLRGPPRNISAIMVEVRRDVMAATANAQVPWDHSALTGDFYFRPVAGVVTGSVPGDAEEARRQQRTRRLDEELGRRPPDTAEPHPGPTPITFH